MFEIDRFFDAFRPNRPDMRAIKAMYEHETEKQSQHPTTVYQSSPLQTERNFLYIIRILTWERAKGELNSIAALSELRPTTEAGLLLATKLRGIITEIDNIVEKMPKR